jgi:hypothetical protein
MTARATEATKFKAQFAILLPTLTIGKQKYQEIQEAGSTLSGRAGTVPFGSGAGTGSDVSGGVRASSLPSFSTTVSQGFHD